MPDDIQGDDTLPINPPIGREPDDNGPVQDPTPLPGEDDDDPFAEPGDGDDDDSGEGDGETDVVNTDDPRSWGRGRIAVNEPADGTNP